MHDAGRKITKETRRSLVTGSAKKGGIDDETKMSLHFSNVDGMVTSASASLFDSYIIPFLLALGASAGQVGLFMAAKNLAYTLSMIPGAKLTERYARKSIMLFSRVVSRLVFFVPLLLIAIFPSPSMIYPAMLFSSLLVFGMGLSHPAWSSLMGDLVPMEIRGRYFGRRNMLLGIAGILATAAGGYILANYGFVPVFVLFAVFGMAAVPFFMKMKEKPLRRVFHYRHRFSFNPSHWPAAIKMNWGLSLFTIYLFLMNFVTMIAGPFYVVYILRDLGMDYAAFAAVITLGAVARIASFRHWGKMEDRFGSRKILIVCGGLGVLTPFLILWTSDLAAVAAVFIIDGLIWSGFDLVVFNYLLDIVPAEKRPQYVANHTFFVGLGVVLGALVGAYLATIAEGASLLAFSGLQLVFLASFILRILIIPLSFRLPEVDIKQTDIVPVRYVFWQTVAVEPAREIMHSAVFTFRYPYDIEKEFKASINAVKYKFTINK